MTRAGEGAIGARRPREPRASSSDATGRDEVAERAARRARRSTTGGRRRRRSAIGRRRVPRRASSSAAAGSRVDERPEVIDRNRARMTLTSRVDLCLTRRRCVVPPATHRGRATVSNESVVVDHPERLGRLAEVFVRRRIAFAVDGHGQLVLVRPDSVRRRRRRQRRGVRRGAGGDRQVRRAPGRRDPPAEAPRRRARGRAASPNEEPTAIHGERRWGVDPVQRALEQLRAAGARRRAEPRRARQPERARAAPSAARRTSPAG